VAPAKASAPAKAPAPAKAGKPAPAKRKKGQKRTQAELAALQSKLDSFVKANDGKRIEEISKALGIPTGELTRPMKKLLDEGKVRSTGERRATRYYGVKRK
jgi:DNA-binding IclR family transcriptional regulator